MVKSLLVFSMTVCLVFATSIGEAQPQRALEDQFGNEFNLSQKACWIISWDRDATERANKYIEKHSNILKECYFIVDTSQIPSGIMMLFVRPAFKEYKHSILLSDNEAFNLSLPFKDGNYTELLFDAHTLKKIKFLPKIDDAL